MQWKKYRGLWLLLCVVQLSVLPVGLRAAPIEVIDDLGRKVTLAEPARRVVSLAPHITENLFSAGAGDNIVGAVAYSNFPVAAQSIPLVGSYKKFNLESIAALQPDLVVGWSSGNGMTKIQQMVDLGFTVYVTEPKNLEDIASSLKRYGQLTGHAEVADAASEHFSQKLAQLRSQYSQQTPVSVFYQVWNQPLQTLNGKHLISDVMRLCGGRNVFADSLALAPKVGVESVMLTNPQAIIASGMGQARPEWLDEWYRWPSLQAVQNDDLYFIHPDLVQRHTIRILQGAQRMCEQLQQVRNRAAVAERPSL